MEHGWGVNRIVPMDQNFLDFMGCQGNLAKTLHSPSPRLLTPFREKPKSATVFSVKPFSRPFVIMVMINFAATAQVRDP